MLTHVDPPVPRRATTEEAGQVAELWLRSRRAAVPAIPAPVHSDEEVRAHFALVIAGCEVWVLDGAEGAVVALLVLRPGWVDQLYVDPARTGQGLGSALLDLAKSRAGGALDLWTFERNVGARRFYERHGFAEVATTAGDNEEGAPDVRYRWTPTSVTPAGARGGST